jgi:two-component system sensor histidine kinase SenX3
VTALVAALVVLVAGLGVWCIRMAVAQRRAVALLLADADRLDPAGRRDGISGLEAGMRRVERAMERVEDLAAAERRRIEDLRAGLAGLPLGIVVLRADGTELVRNDAARHLVGVRVSDALIEETLHQVLRAGLAGETRRRTLDLHGPPRRVVVVSGAPFPDADRVEGAFAMAEDVTERSRVEAARSDFVANLSHELKTPVGALALLAETLGDEVRATAGDDPELLIRLADRLTNEAHRVNRIVDDLLELSRIESSPITRKEPVAVDLILGEAFERVRPVAERRRIAVRVPEVSSRVTVLGDRRQLVAAVGNLVENAVKYSGEGSGVDVSVRTDGTTVTIEVADHGIGIPSRDLDRIFERFYRVDRARSRDTGGTGLGLAIVRHAVRNHEGTVSVRSQEGVGSTFTLQLPAGPGPVAVAPVAEVS